uniref:Uncharacterized protein TCIL3000_3_2550 n=1 Tax=Trypanosoma congolense (strain IL3000) TaxID=1068625 RepID=G0UKB7_TRYCI|nr:unnamed protein product [Trypanosoma congolense IL3000]
MRHMLLPTSVYVCTVTITTTITIHVCTLGLRFLCRVAASSSTGFLRYIRCEAVVFLCMLILLFWVSVTYAALDLAEQSEELCFYSPWAFPLLILLVGPVTMPRPNILRVVTLFIYYLFAPFLLLSLVGKGFTTTLQRVVIAAFKSCHKSSPRAFSPKSTKRFHRFTSSNSTLRSTAQRQCRHVEGGPSALRSL